MTRPVAVIRLYEDVFAEILRDLEIIEADGLNSRDAHERARRIRETLWQEHETPLQQASERAEALGDEDAPF